MGFEIVLLLIAALAIAGIGMSRRKHRVFHEEEHHGSIVCVISFYNRGETLPKIEAFFEQEYITVRDLKREIKRVEERDLFTNTYLLGMPRRVDQGRLVGYLSAIPTVQSVQIRPR
ncbi:MAG: hypothetical protein IKU34_03995 [Clostridia bacterium]|nr:hypothetical protein [Clostridia bacterium]